MKGGAHQMAGSGQEKPGGDTANGINPEVANAFFAVRAKLQAMQRRGFLETGLKLVYPEGLDCLTANSFFADPFRGDGSRRTQKYYQGLHGGLDIPAKGVDILAMADGEVVEKSAGGNIGGIKVVLRHSPDDTGLSAWTFTEYKHLKEESPLEIGARVRLGTPIGIAWNTGTQGKAYGPGGHYHLHLSTWYNDSGEFKNTPMMLIPSDGYWLDPLAMLRGRPPLESTALKNLPDSEKQVDFAYKTADGKITPPGARIIWPFVCHPARQASPGAAY